MAGVIDSLYVNHFIEPVMYEVFVRVIQYERDYSELHVLSEYLMDVYQNKKSNSEFNIIKTRAKPFSSAGKEYFKDMRMISPITIYLDNILKNKNEVFKKKNLKHFDFEISHEMIDSGSNLIILKCSPIEEKKYLSDITLYIDKESFAIQKMIDFYPDSKNIFIEIGFKKVNDKWYLDYSKKMISTRLFSKSQPVSKNISERLAIYNINEQVEYDSKAFKGTFNIMTAPIKWYIGDWSDDFWENYNYVPLPAWVQDKVTNALSQ